MEYIIGKITYKNDKLIILEANNIGYKIFINNTEDIIINKTYKFFIYERNLYVHSVLSKNLYGFKEIQEKILFKNFISINGIGPKNAMQLISIDYNDLVENIKNYNYSFFVNENKINKKIVDILFQNIKLNNIVLNEIKLEHVEIKNDLISSLKYLGFQNKEINSIISNLDLNDSIDNLIKTSIEKINNKNDEIKNE